MTSWLLDETSDDRAVEVIAKSDLLRGEAAMLLPVLRQAAMRPASPDEIRDIIGSRFATFPQPKRSPAEAAAFWADYFTALDGMTAAQVEAGMVANVNHPQAEFLWRPGPLAEAARSVATPGRWAKAYSRARKACEQTATPKVAAGERPSASEMTAIMADFHARMAAKEPPRPQRRDLPPTPCAQVDDRGVSEHMRALLARTARKA